MTGEHGEPLDPETWFARLQRLEGATTEPLAPDRLIRMTYNLVRLAPLPMRDLLPSPLPEEELEAILDCHAYVDAILHLMGTRFAFHLLKKPGDNDYRATVGLDPASQIGEATSRDCATAMLTAWVRCMNHLQTRSALVTDRDLHIYRSGSPPSSTEH